MLKKNEHSLSSLISWLKTKDPNESYDYCNVNACLGYQYKEFLGEEYHMPSIMAEDLDTPIYLFDFDRQMEIIARGNYVERRTFGKALSAAKSVEEGASISGIYDGKS